MLMRASSGGIALIPLIEFALRIVLAQYPCGSSGRNTAPHRITTLLIVCSFVGWHLSDPMTTTKRTTTTMRPYPTTVRTVRVFGTCIYDNGLIKKIGMFFSITKGSGREVLSWGNVCPGVKLTEGSQALLPQCLVAMEITIRMHG